MNKNLVEVVNSKGYVVRKVQDGEDNKFGKTNIITIENGEHTITFTTNVLHGINYFKIHQIYNYHQERIYRAERFHLKFVSFISGINGAVFLKEKEK